MICRNGVSALLAFAALLGVSHPSGAWAQGRPDVGGAEAAVVAGHPLAAAAGADVLRRGGNAVDAAITMAAVLSVVRPHMNGVGGDAFMLIRDARDGAIHALNGSGRAGSRAAPDFFAARGLDEVPSRGVLSVSVPGAVRAWADALERFGTITLAEALAPAIRYAESGFPVSTTLAADIASSRARIAEDPALAAIFLPGGRPSEVGSLLRQPELGRTLRAIAAEGPDAFYLGETARRIAAFMEAEGGLVTAADLAAHHSTWEAPIETVYHRRPVIAFPPNTQGVALLEQLNLAEHFDLGAMGRNTTEYIHTLVEVKKLAYADRDRYVADPAFVSVPVDRLISKQYARDLVAEIRQRAAATSDPDGPSRDGDGDTVYLCVVDREGNAVSMIESLFAAFGSGRVVPGTGVILHNRGALFTLDPEHPNVVAPGKRPYHTLSPAMVLNPDRSLFAVMGTPGGDGQPQTLVQVLHNLTVFGMTPQQAVEAPRWRSLEDGRLVVEPGIDEAVRSALESRGHRVVARPRPSSEFGGAQLILIGPESGARITGADPRREAYGIAW